jgi:hypothetical protein
LLVLIAENHHLKNKNSNSNLNDNESNSNGQFKHPLPSNQLNSDILNYLLAILDNLPSLKWVDDNSVAINTNNAKSSNKILIIYFYIFFLILNHFKKSYLLLKYLPLCLTLV